MRTLVRIGVAILCLMGGAHAWWEKLYLPEGETLWKDTAGPDTPRGGHRLSATGALYLANGKSLLYRNSSYPGSSWTKFTHAPDRQPQPFQEPAPLASRPDLVLWGNWRSRDNGRTWEPLPFPSTRFLVYGIGAGGLCLGGGRGQAIDRSLDSGRTWTQVFKGTDSGFVRHIVFGDSGRVYAALQPARILVSKDGGATWNPGISIPDLGSAGYRIQAMAFTTDAHIRRPSVFRFLWSLHVDPLSGNSRLVKHLADSGQSAPYTFGLPDSPWTSLSSRGGESVIVGGGRQVFRCRGNEGFVEAGDLARIQEDDLVELQGEGENIGTFALTRNAVFGSYYESSIRRRDRPAGRAGPGPGRVGRAHRADGRRLLPAPPLR